MSARTFIRIAIEGIDGCGKSEQVNRLADTLRERGWWLVQTREPSATGPLGSLIRRQFNDGAALTDDEMCVLFAADRITERLRFEALAASAGPGDGPLLVVSDRSSLSATAYHDDGTPPQRAWLRRLSAPTDVPDLAVVITIPVEEAEARLAARGDLDRYEDPDRIRRAAHNYQRMVRDSTSGRVVAVDGIGTPDEVAERIFKVVQHWLPE